MTQRLLDPHNLASHDHHILQQKLIKALSRLAVGARNGGNPFIYSLTIGKPHILKDLKAMGFPPTAATDGINVYWDPSGMRELNVSQILCRLKHEGYHIALLHCSRGLIKWNRILWNICIDFVANNMIEQEYRIANRTGDMPFKPTEHPIWKGALGYPIALEELKQILIRNPNVITDIRKDEKLRPADYSIVARSAESIYRELYKWLFQHGIDIDNLEFDDLGNCDCGNHMVLKASDEDILQQILRAATAASRMHGTIPSCVSSMLDDLSDPQTSYYDYLSQTISKVKRIGGNKPDNTNFRKRFICQKMYLPSYTNYRPLVAILMDTSGSMSDADIAFGMSEAQIFDSKADLIIIPVDAAPHWDSVTKISRASELPTVKVVGRGGTVFDDFFKDYRSKLRKYGKIDVIIVITDGGLSPVPIELRPNCDVAWVLTDLDSGFQPNFGKVIKLYRAQNQLPGS